VRPERLGKFKNSVVDDVNSQLREGLRTCGGKAVFGPKGEGAGDWRSAVWRAD
jgi:hypothetical protein